MVRNNNNRSNNNNTIISNSNNIITNSNNNRNLIRRRDIARKMGRFVAKENPTQYSRCNRHLHRQVR